MYADLVLRGGKIITVDERESTAEAVAVKYGRIVAVGKDGDVKPLVGPKTKVIELQGRAVIPGLMDSHSPWPMRALVGYASSTSAKRRASSR